MKTILSLFDYSGVWPKPFADAGYSVHSLDLKRGDNILDFRSADDWLERFPDVDGILAGPPCTDFTNSGAQYWPAKDADGRTAASLELVRQVLRCVDLYRPTDQDYDGTFFWALENPVGRLPKLLPQLGKAWHFDPCDFAGYLSYTAAEENEIERLRRKDGKGFTIEDACFVMQTNLYTKKTGLWGEFNRDIPKRRLEPIRCNSQGSPLQTFGGNTDKTKELRSNTPLGFSIAFYEANKDWRPLLW